MTAAFFEVLQDLWWFALGRRTVQAMAPVVTEPPIVDTPVTEPPLDLVVPAISTEMVAGRGAYVIAQEAICLQQPKVTIDSRLGVIPFATKVQVDVIEGEYAHVIGGGLQGWVRTEMLTDDKNQIFPQFEPAYVYSADHEETQKLRRLTDDELLGHELGAPLQSSEYVLYRIQQAGVRLNWPEVRPRPAGKWQSILRGNSGVLMSIEPKTGSVMEYTGNEDRSFLAYVESVRPDSSITISSVGRVDDGEFRTEEFSQADWREWRPIFITFI